MGRGRFGSLQPRIRVGEPMEDGHGPRWIAMTPPHVRVRHEEANDEDSWRHMWLVVVFRGCFGRCARAETQLDVAGGMVGVKKTSLATFCCDPCPMRQSQWWSTCLGRSPRPGLPRCSRGRERRPRCVTVHGSSLHGPQLEVRQSHENGLFSRQRRALSDALCALFFCSFLYPRVTSVCLLVVT